MRRFLIGSFETSDMLGHDRRRIETDTTALCLKTETHKLDWRLGEFFLQQQQEY